MTKAARNGKLTQASVNKALRLAVGITEESVTHALKADVGEYGKISRCLDAIEALDESKLRQDLEKLKKGTLTDDENKRRQEIEKKLKEGISQKMRANSGKLLRITLAIFTRLMLRLMVEKQPTR